MEPVLKGICAFVEVWSSNRTENYSKAFEKQLLDMGAKVSKTFNKHVTHVVFKEGRSATWRKAQKAGVKIVSVLWVEKCRETGIHVDESLFPAVYNNEGLLLKHKCMQPKDFVEKSPENDRKLQRRLDKMAKELAKQKIGINAETDTPVLLFEDDGSLVYSPVNKIRNQSSAVERRIKEMKEKRENLSPTASPMSQTPPHSLPGDCPLSTCLTNAEDVSLQEEQMEVCLNSSVDDLWGTDKSKRQKKEIAEPTCGTQTHVHVSRSASVNSPSCSYDQKSLIPKQPNRRSLSKEKILQRTFNDNLEKDLEKFPEKNQKDENTMTTSVANKNSLQIKDLGYFTPSRKTAKLNTVPALICSLSNSPVSRGDLNTCSCDRSFPVDRSDCLLEHKKRKKLQTVVSVKLSSSELRASGSKNEFLQGVNTYSNDRCTEDASYEDFFSSYNLNKNEVQVQVPQESQNPSDASCKESLRSMDSNDMSSCKPRTASEKSRKKSIQANDVAVKKTFKPAEHTESVPLNCMSDGEKAEIAEALDSDLVNKRPQHAHEKSYGTDINYCTRATGDENEASECDVTDGSCKVFNEQKNKHNGGVRKTRRIQKPTRTLVMTSMSPEEQNAVIQVVNKLGDFLFSNVVCETTSHVVTGSPRRTLNVMLGIARGCWIVSYEWVLWSLEVGHWISEEPYELSSNFPAAPICRLQRHLSTGNYQQNLFSNQPVMFVSPTSQPPCKNLIELIQLSGGKVCKALRQAKICIGKYPGKKYQEIKCLSEKWILDSVTQHTICPMENYIFQL
nr:microcephalin isoform X2 [Anser cygnoides]